MNADKPLIDAPKTQAPRVHRRGLTVFALTAVFSVLVDQLSKAWIRHALPIGGEMPLIPGWIHLSHVLNHGAAWGLLSGRRWLLIIVTLGVIGVVANLARDIAGRSRLAGVGLGLILGGAVGNLIDRAASGVVTDFIDLDTPIQFLRTFPVWNGADSALTIGVILLLIEALLQRRHSLRSS